MNNTESDTPHRHWITFTQSGANTKIKYSEVVPDLVLLLT